MSSSAASTKFWFNQKAADHVVEFFATYLRHVKGKWAGCQFNLLPWQRKEIIEPLFGWKRKDGTRRYRTAYIEVPRKSGKSTLAAGIALYLLFFDEEPGAEVYSAAVDREQAAIVFELARQMVEASPKLLAHCETYRRSIVVPSTASSYKVLSADVPAKHGLNAHGIIFDELHAQPNRELWDVLTTSTGARQQPLVVAITTAGYDRNSICWEQHDYAEKVLNKVIDDPSFFAYIVAAKEDEDWRDFKTLKRVNLGLGTTITKEYLKTELKRAMQIPAYENTFKRLHLDLWTQQETKWLSLEAWDETAGIVDSEKLKGRLCYGGLDLASTTDIAALALVFPPVENDQYYRVLPFFWIPQENMRERSLRDKVPYDVWVKEKFIEATPGNVIDYSAIRLKIEDLGKEYNIREISFDRWGAVQISQELDAAGFTVIPFGQGFKDMSPPTKELLNLVLSKKLKHGGNPVLRWMADNMVVKTDPAGNVKPDKSKSTQRIDGMVALIMALDRCIRQELKKSIYQERGILTI